MADSVLKQVTSLPKLSFDELKALYVSLYGTEPPAYNRDLIIKRLAYRLQEIAYGGLPERVRQRLDEVLVDNGYDENAMPTGVSKRKRKVTEDHPVVGTVLVREWRGKRYEVTSLRDGFEFEGRKYRSLSAIAAAITGAHQSGVAFFGLKPVRRRS